MVRDEKYTKMGFFIYKKFYDLNFRSMKERTYDDFMNSNYFTSFTKFGRYLMDIHAINPEAFVDFLLKAQIPLNKWETPLIYEQYIRELNKRESVSSAVERNLLLMQQWEMDTGNPWYEFFLKVNPNLATQWIRSGRLSPWILYSANTSKNLFERFTDEQLNLIDRNIDPKFWTRKFEESPDDFQFVKSLLEESGL